MKTIQAAVFFLLLALLPVSAQSLIITYTDGEGYRWLLSSSYERISILGGESGKEMEEIPIEKDTFDQIRALALSAVASVPTVVGPKLEEYKGCAITVSEPSYHVAFRCSHLPTQLVEIQKKVIALGSTKTRIGKEN